MESRAPGRGARGELRGASVAPCASRPLPRENGECQGRCPTGTGHGTGHIDPILPNRIEGGGTWDRRDGIDLSGHGTSRRSLGKSRVNCWPKHGLARKLKWDGIDSHRTRRWRDAKSGVHRTRSAWRAGRAWDGIDSRSCPSRVRDRGTNRDRADCGLGTDLCNSLRNRHLRRSKIGTGLIHH